jgi:LPS export ABC transporter protein LptC
MKKINFAVVLILALFCFFSCSMEKSDSDAGRVELPDMLQQNYKHNIYKNKRVYLEAQIGLAKSYEKKNQIICEDVYAQLSNTKNELTMKINSDNAIIDNAVDEFLFQNNVVIDKLDQGITLYTNELVLNYNQNVLKSEGEVRILKADGSQLLASSMNTDLNSQTTEFSNIDMNYFYEEEKK